MIICCYFFVFKNQENLLQYGKKINIEDYFRFYIAHWVHERKQNSWKLQNSLWDIKSQNVTDYYQEFNTQMQKKFKFYSVNVYFGLVHAEDNEIAYREIKDKFVH